MALYYNSSREFDSKHRTPSRRWPILPVQDQLSELCLTVCMEHRNRRRSAFVELEVCGQCQVLLPSLNTQSL